MKISMDRSDRRPPRFHAAYGGDEVPVPVGDIEVPEGGFPNKQLKMLLGWAALHRDGPMENRALAERKRGPSRPHLCGRGGKSMARDAGSCISRGFDRPMAEYMAAGRRGAVSAAPMGASSVLVSFDDGEKRSYDLSGLIAPGTAFSFLSDPEALARVCVDEDGSVWWDRDPEIDSRKFWSNKVDVSADDPLPTTSTLIPSS